MQHYVNVNNEQVRNMHSGELKKLRDKIKRLALNQKQFSSEILSGRGNNTIPKETFLQALGLVTKEEFTKLTSKSNERRRRKTANPRFSHEAIQAKKAALEPLQRRQLESRNSRGNGNAGANTAASKKPNGRNQAKAKANDQAVNNKTNSSQQNNKNQNTDIVGKNNIVATNQKSSNAKKVASNNSNNNGNASGNQQAQRTGDTNARQVGTNNKPPVPMVFLDALYMRCREYRVQQMFKSDEIRKKRANNEQLKEELLMLQGRELGLMEAIEAIKSERHLFSISEATLIDNSSSPNNNNDLTANNNNNININHLSNNNDLVASKQRAQSDSVNGITNRGLGLASATNSNNSQCINLPQQEPEQPQHQHLQQEHQNRSSISEPMDLYSAMRCEESLDGLND